jgi:hypothetical protein
VIEPKLSLTGPIAIDLEKARKFLPKATDPEIIRACYEATLLLQTPRADQGDVLELLKLLATEAGKRRLGLW